MKPRIIVEFENQAQMDAWLRGIMDGWGEDQAGFSWWWQREGTDGTHREDYEHRHENGVMVCRVDGIETDEDEED